MSAPHAARWSRRAFLGGLTLVGTAGMLGLSSGPVAAEPPPETTTIRLIHQIGATCLASRPISPLTSPSSPGFHRVSRRRSRFHRDPVPRPIQGSGWNSTAPMSQDTAPSPLPSTRGCPSWSVGRHPVALPASIA
jgi:hypothetical protein